MEYIYVCSPYRGDTEANVAFAISCCRRVIDEGHVPIAPHLYFTQFLNDSDPKERALGMRLGLELIEVCGGLWVFGDKITEGMQGEIDHAISIGVEVVMLGS